MSERLGADDFIVTKGATRQDLEALPRVDLCKPLGIGLGVFLAQDFPPLEPYVEGLLSSGGGGWIAGEEKLAKTYYALEEALGLSLGLPVCGRFPVPVRRRVLFIEEEDPPQRTHGRLRALLRGHDLDPDDPALRADLDLWFHIEVWSGFTLDSSQMVNRLDAAIADFRPAVVYLDVLRKITTRDLNKAQEASALLGVVDTLRRKYAVIFRMLHHYRKIQQGFRAGRGSQEIGGSYVLGAWGESSLFFEPVGRKQGAVKVEVQTKDGPPQPAFLLKLESEGPSKAPMKVRLIAEEISTASAAETLKEQVFQAIATVNPVESICGKRGIPLKAIKEAVNRSDRPVRTAIKALIDEGRVDVVGEATRRTALYGVIGQ